MINKSATSISLRFSRNSILYCLWHFTLILLFASDFPIINEVMYSPAGTNSSLQWVEIYNPTGISQSLGGWQIEVAGDEFQVKYTFPSNVVIPSGMYFVVGGNGVSQRDYTAVLSLPDASVATAGVRLISADGQYKDTLLYGSPNTFNLPDDIYNPAFEFVSLAPEGASLARKPDGLDTNTINDWVALSPPTPKLPNFPDNFYYDLAIIDLSVNTIGTIHRLSVIIHDLSTGFVDNSMLVLSVKINGISIYENTPNLTFINKIAEFVLEVSLVAGMVNNITAEISYPQDIDTSNNTKTLLFYPSGKAIIINEIQYWESVAESEWIELFNRTNEAVYLEDAYILDAAGRRSVFSALIAPLDYVVICQNALNFYATYHDLDLNKVIQTTGWAALNNTTETIELYNSGGLLLDSHTYTGTSSMRDRSLERVNPYSDESILWAYSTAAGGSTPLAKNSQTPADAEASIENVTITLTGNTFEHRLIVKNTGLFGSFSGDILISYKFGTSSSFQLVYTQPIYVTSEEEIIFTTAFSGERGYHHFKYTILYKDFYHSFLNGEPSVVVNEIMFNPYTSEPEWVEFIRIIERGTMPTEGLKFFADNDSIHIPYFESEFALLTANANNVTFLRTNYDIPESIPIFTGLRNLNNTGETFKLADYDNNIYETFAYTNAFSPRQGISAERISPKSTPVPQNWAASRATSTPGKQNSIYMDVTPTESRLELQNNPFSPYKSERLIIKINVPQLQVRADVRIFDLKGREIISLANKEIVSGTSEFIWDGCDKSRNIVIPGIYPLLVQIDDTTGNTIFQTKRVIYVGR